MASPAVSLYQDSISSSLNAVIEQRTPQMPMLKQATSKTTPKKPKGKRKPKVKQEPTVKQEATDWSMFNYPGASNSETTEGCDVPVKKLKQEKITDHLPKVKKKHDRFNGMPEEEVVLRTLPDHLAENLDIVIVGINPGLFAAYVGHHYAGPGNHFWKCVYLSGLIPEPMNAYDDYKLLDYGIGFTNICARTTRGSADLKTPEIKEGGKILKEKLLKYRPKIAAFNGKGIYEIFCGHKNFSIGKQPEKLEGTDTVVYVMPSSSARCAQLPRAVDKVPFYEALRKLRDHLKGDIKELDDSEVTFPKLELKVKKEEPADEGYDAALQGNSKTGEKPKPKPKKKRNRKSAEATVTSGSVDSNQPYVGEVSQPYSGEVHYPYHMSGQIAAMGGARIKREHPMSAPNFPGMGFPNNFPLTTHGMTLPSTLPSHPIMSHVTSQSQVPFFPLPFTQSAAMFNPTVTQMQTFSQHQMAHMASNGFPPHWSHPITSTHQQTPTTNQHPLNMMHGNHSSNQHPLNMTSSSNQHPLNMTSPNSSSSQHPLNMTSPNSSSNQHPLNMTSPNSSNQHPLNMTCPDSSNQQSIDLSTNENKDGASSQSTSNNGAPFIKSEPIDDGYKEFHLTQL